MNRFECPTCAKRLKYTDEMAGKRAKCSRCQTGFVLPGEGAPVAEPPLRAARAARPLPPPKAEPRPAPPRPARRAEEIDVELATDDEALDFEAATPRRTRPRRTGLVVAGVAVALLAVLGGVGFVLVRANVLPGSLLGSTPDAVVGVKGMYLYSDAECNAKASETPLALGTVLKVKSPKDDDVVEVTDPTGTKGWVYRGALCTPAELKRRNDEFKGLSNVLFLASRPNEGVFLYMGSIQIRNGGMVVEAGDAFWMNSTMKGKTITLLDQQVVGDPNVILLVAQGNALVKLPVWNRGQ